MTEGGILAYAVLFGDPTKRTADRQVSLNPSLIGVADYRRSAATRTA
jgi:hypothetical protein